MEFTTIASALLRRWYVVLLGLALTSGLAFVAHDAVPPTYSAAGSVLLLPPGASVPNGSNPLLALGGLEQPAALVVAYLAGDEARQAFDKTYPDATYDIVLDPLSRGPLILITVKDPSADEVMRALDFVLASLPEALSSLQDQVDAPAVSRVTSMPLSVDVRPTTVRSDSVRALIAAVGVGLVLTLVGAVSIDSLALRQRERRAAMAPVPSVDDPEPTPATEPPLTEVAASDDEPKPEWPAGVTRIQMRDFASSEEQYGADWPPQVKDDPSLDDAEARVAPRA